MTSNIQKCLFYNAFNLPSQNMLNYLVFMHKISLTCLGRYFTSSPVPAFNCPVISQYSNQFQLYRLQQRKNVLISCKIHACLDQFRWRNFSWLTSENIDLPFISISIAFNLNLKIIFTPNLPQAYSEYSIFWENSFRLNSRRQFLQKALSQMFDKVLNTSLSSFRLQ